METANPPTTSIGKTAPTICYCMLPSNVLCCSDNIQVLQVPRAPSPSPPSLSPLTVTPFLHTPMMMSHLLVLSLVKHMKLHLP